MCPGVEFLAGALWGSSSPVPCVPVPYAHRFNAHPSIRDRVAFVESIVDKVAKHKAFFTNRFDAAEADESIYLLSMVQPNDAAQYCLGHINM